MRHRLSQDSLPEVLPSFCVCTVRPLRVKHPRSPEHSAASSRPDFGRRLHGTPLSTKRCTTPRFPAYGEFSIICCDCCCSMRNCNCSFCCNCSICCLYNLTCLFASLTIT